MSRSRDSISSLPDEILGKIVSLLPTKLAASTTVLSKRWRNVLGLVEDSLSFDESMVVYGNEEEARNGSHRFSDFVDKTLALLSKSRIKKFSLCRVHKHGSYTWEYSGCVNRWIWTAMEHGLSELHLYAPTPRSGVFIETKLLTSNTLVKLTISGEYDLEAERVFLPSLKSLSLLSIGIDYPNYSRLLHGCPVLEELYIRDGDFSHQPPSLGTYVESASIKRLVVFINLPKYKDDAHRLIYLEAPSLVYLDYSSYVSEKYQFLDLDLLAEARLSLRLWVSTNDYDYYDDDDEPRRPPIFGDVTGLVAGIRNITTLSLVS